MVRVWSRPLKSAAMVSWRIREPTGRHTQVLKFLLRLLSMGSSDGQFLRSKLARLGYGTHLGALLTHLLNTSCQCSNPTGLVLCHCSSNMHLIGKLSAQFHDLLLRCVTVIVGFVSFPTSYQISKRRGMLRSQTSIIKEQRLQFVAEERSARSSLDIGVEPIEPLIFLPPVQ